MRSETKGKRLSPDINRSESSHDEHIHILLEFCDLSSGEEHPTREDWDSDGFETDTVQQEWKDPPLLMNDASQVRREKLRCALYRHFEISTVHPSIPVEKLSRILVLSISTSEEAVALADKLQGTEIKVIDRTVKSLEENVPPNLYLLVDDWKVNNDWGFSYDCVIISTWEVHNWPRVLREARRALRPGGWLQFRSAPVVARDSNNSELQHHPLNRICGLLRNALEKSDVRCAVPTPEQVKAHGLVNVLSESQKIPFDPSGSDWERAAAVWLLEEVMAHVSFVSKPDSKSWEKIVGLVDDVWSCPPKGVSIEV